MLRDAVVHAANVILQTQPVVARFLQTIQNAGGVNDVAALRWWVRRLKTMPRFGVIDPVHTAGGGANSGNRMTPALMNPLPTPVEFAANPDSVLRQLVVRALHRYVDDFVLRAIELLNPAAAVTVDGLDKRQLSRQFLHNSQRAYWNLFVLNWARLQVVPVAQNAILLALS
jgi:hypothetical protein